jgi:hypothetical protein
VHSLVVHGDKVISGFTAQKDAQKDLNMRRRDFVKAVNGR